MRYLLIWAGCALIAGAIDAQPLPSQLHFEQVPVSGTIQSTLTEDIVQDGYGMIWVAKNMLYRYNGREFISYNSIEPDSSFFGRRDITRLHWDRVDKRLLIGTRTQGLLQFRYQNDRIEKLHSRGTAPIINQIAQTDDGKVWISSFSGGIFELKNDTLAEIKGSFGALNPSGMLAIGNELWVGCLNEIVVIRDGVVRKRISLRDFSEYVANAIRAHALMLDREGHLWVGTERDGLIVLDTGSHQAIKKFSPSRKPFYSSITRLAQDDQGLVWILTKGDGVILYSPSLDEFIQAEQKQTEARTISGDHCTSICIDRSGIVWIGAAGAINKHDRGKIKFEHIFHSPSQPLSLSDDNVRGIYQDEQGIIYLATSDGYLNIVDRKNQRTDRVKTEIQGADEFVTPLSIAPLSKNELLIGTSDGLLLLDTRTKKLNTFAPLHAFTKNTSVRQVLRNGDYLFISLRSSVVQYHIPTGEKKIFGRNEGIDNVSHIYVDQSQRLWLGSKKGVLHAAAPYQDFKFISLEEHKFRTDSAYLLTLSMQQIGNELWVSTFNHGIHIFDLTQEPPRLVNHRSVKNGLPDNTVYATLPDEAGQIWLAHNSGLSVYQPKADQYTHFTVSEGVQDEEFNRLAYFQDKSGLIILGGINGINLFDPAKVVPSQINLDIQLVGLHVLSLQNVEKTFYPLLETPEAIELTYAQNSLRFDFFVPDYHEPIRYTTRYRLEPFDPAWIETDNLYSSTYANLPSGEYTFYAKATGPDGREHTTQATVVILPPFWKTWWFIALSVAVVILVLYVFAYARVRRSETDRLRLETLLKIRTREIERSREELENLNKKKDLIFSILSHDLRSPLTTLKGFLGLLIENSDSLSKDELRKHASTIRNSVTNSLDLIDNTLFWSLSQTGTIQFSPSTVPLAPMFEKIKGLYQLTAEKKKIELIFENVDGLSVHADENMLYVLLRNLVSNALKFTPEGKTIQAGALEQGRVVAIRIKDHGIGMSKQEIEKIFELDNPAVKRGTSSEKGTGLGLLLCKKFVELNQGKLLIESEEGAGSQFTVLLPKG